LDIPAPPPEAAEVEPAPPPPPASFRYGPTNIHPVGARERALCDAASQPDYLYLLAGPLSLAGAITLESYVFKFDERPGFRTIGPGLVGLTWGFTLGSIYPSFQRCSPTWVLSAPREGDVREWWPVAVAVAAAAMLTAPVVVGVETGPVPFEWSVAERQARLFVAGGAGAIGALVPYVLPPKTWRAIKELQRIRAGADERGFFIGYSARF
jgi:hypothetical protein